MRPGFDPEERNCRGRFIGVIPSFPVEHQEVDCKVNVSRDKSTTGLFIHG